MSSARAIDTSTLPYDTVAASLDFIADNLRPADLDEVTASTTLSPRETLRESWMSSSRAWLIADRSGLPIAAFGVSPTVTPGVGAVWLLGTSGVEEEWVAVARQTRRYLTEMHEDYQVLWNYIDARNELALEWLLRSGFHLIDADSSFGPEGRLFFQFARAHV